MKKTFVILVLLIFSSNLFAWEKVPVPDSVDKKTKSPWNFYENFEDGKFRFKYVTNSTNISNSPGKKPYKIKKDLEKSRDIISNLPLPNTDDIEQNIREELKLNNDKIKQNEKEYPYTAPIGTQTKNEENKNIVV